jgi:hypothetical protein
VTVLGIPPKDRFVAIGRGTKFKTPGVDNTSPVAKLPLAYVATIEGLKIVPGGLLLNALNITGNVWLVI